MRGALGSHMNLRRMQRDWQPIFVWDFTKQSAGAVVLPSGLAFARASSGHRVQDGANAFTAADVSSNDVGCIGRLDSSHGYGLRLAPLRVNFYGYSRTAHLAPGTTGQSCVYTTGRVGPDGSTNAIRGQTPSGGYSRFQTLAAVTGFHVLSAWARAGLGSGAYQVVGAYSGTTGAAVQGTVGANWSLVASAGFSYPAATQPNVNPWDGRANGTLGSIAGARDCDLDAVQFEAGRYPTCPIITSGGSTATRAQERLTINQTEARALVAPGRIGVYFKFHPLASVLLLDPSTEGMLLKSVGLTPAFSAQILGNSQQLVISDGTRQSITGTGAFSWSRGDLVEIVLEMGAGRSAARWRINGGSITTANFSGLDESLSALDASLTGIDLLCSSTSVIMPSFVEKVIPFVPGRAPF